MSGGHSQLKPPSEKLPQSHREPGQGGGAVISIRRAHLFFWVELGPLVILTQIGEPPGGSVWTWLSADCSETWKWESLLPLPARPTPLNVSNLGRGTSSRGCPGV